jgi:tRNA threonylcarbamoyl adenosine modification protein YeaZ
MLLAIDTSTDCASIALVQDSKVLAEATWYCRQNHSVELLPSLANLLDEAKVELQSTSCVIVAKGPGSFNGLRVGLSTAKGLAFSLGIPIIGISSLELEAYQHAETGLPTCPIFSAGRGEIAAALYQKKGHKWHQLSAEHVTTVEALVSEIEGEGKTLFCGEYVPLVASRLTKKLGQRAVIAAPQLRRASLLVELAKPRIEAGDYDNSATLQPLYFRRPAITQPKHR